MENQQKNSAPENNSDNRNSNNNKKKPSKTVVIWIVSILLTFMIWQGITAIQQSKQEKITYILFEDNMEFEQQECREDVIRETYPLVYTSEDGRIRIYET